MGGEMDREVGRGREGVIGNEGVGMSDIIG